MTRRRHPRLVPGQTVTAQPYEARRCPECNVWVYTAAGPFAEGDRTKTLADILHAETEHDPERGASTAGTVVTECAWFPYNEEPVQAVYEGRKDGAR